MNYNKMDADKAMIILMEYSGKRDVCQIFMKQNLFLTEPEMNTLWKNYLEFMVLKAFHCDLGSHTSMKLSTCELMDDLWHCHVLCTQRYHEFMQLINSINPMVDFIHHSLLLAYSSEDEKNQRREATSEAYRCP